MVAGKLSVPIRPFCGWVDKEGGAIKTWKRRWMVLTTDREMYYYTDLAAKDRGESKGSFSLEGYEIVEDPIAAQTQRNRKIADMIGWTDRTSIPQPTRYPPNTIELYHHKDRLWHFAPLSSAEKNEWVKCLRNALIQVTSYKSDFAYSTCFYRAMAHSLEAADCRNKIPIWQDDFRLTIFQFATEQIEPDLFYDKYKRLTGSFLEQAAQYQAIRVEFHSYLREQIRTATNDLLLQIKEKKRDTEARIISRISEISALHKTVKEEVGKANIDLIKRFIASHLAPNIETTFNLIEQPIKQCFVEADRLLKSHCEDLMNELERKTRDRRLREAAELIEPLIQTAVDSASLSPLLQACTEVGLRIESMRKSMTSHLNAKEITHTLSHLMTIFVVRGFTTLEVELSLSLSSDPTRGEPDRLPKIVGKILDSVFDRFKFDARVMTQRITLNLMHAILDLPFFRAAMAVLDAAKGQIREMVPTSMIEIFNADCIMNDILYTFSHTTIVHTIGAKMAKIPARPDLPPLPPISKTTEEDWLETNCLPFA